MLLRQRFGDGARPDMTWRWLFFVAWVTPSLCFGWGFTAHRRLASLIQAPLPAQSCLKAWLSSKQSAAWQDTACNPDRWRYMDSPQYDPNEWSRHYLEIDRINPPLAYPREWAEVQTTFGPYAVKNGQVPFRVEDMYGQLVEAFRAKNEQQVLTLAFLLSHYVTDSFSLLHDTLNFDPNGLHSRWETDMFSTSANLNGISQLAASYYGTPGTLDPRYATFDVVLVGNAQLPALLAADTANPTMPAFYAAVKDLTARRWGDALTVLSSLLWQAWADAGAPELSGFSASCSRAKPSEPARIIGYPVAGGFTSRDAGFFRPDASVVDAGYDDGGEPYEGDGGFIDPDGELPDGGTEPPDTTPDAGCGCNATPPVASLAVLLAARWLSRRRRVSERAQ